MNKNLYLPIKNTFRNAYIITNGIYQKCKNQHIGKRIIALHDISDINVFRDKMQWLKDNYEITSIEKLLATDNDDKTQIAITFDDGYDSWINNAIPVLDKYNIPATFFICSGFIGLTNYEAHDFVQRYLKRAKKLKPLSIQQLRIISSNPIFEIGGHTTHHINLGKYHSKEVLTEEITFERKQLEEWTEKPVRWFAYPFGGKNNISERSKEIIKASGYAAAFTIIPKFKRDIDDKFEIGRDSLNIYSSKILWESWLNGGYDRIRL